MYFIEFFIYVFERADPNLEVEKAPLYGVVGMLRR